MQSVKTEPAEPAPLTAEQQEQVTRFMPLARRVARRWARSVDDAEAEAMVALCTAAAEYNPDIGPFDRWASTVIFRHLSKLSAKKRTRDRHEFPLQSDPASPLTKSWDAEGMVGADPGGPATSIPGRGRRDARPRRNRRANGAA